MSKNVIFNLTPTESIIKLITNTIFTLSKTIKFKKYFNIELLFNKSKNNK